MKKSVVLGMAIGFIGAAKLIQKNKHIAKFLTKNN